MRYFRDNSTNEVFGYDADQASLVASASSDPNMEEITGSWPPEIDEVAIKSEDMRSIRDGLLFQSDWTQVADAPVDQAAWAEYRQKLRDVPQQAGFPAEVDWPAKP